MRAHAESVNLQFERPLDEVIITNLICLYVVAKNCIPFHLKNKGCYCIPNPVQLAHN